ncbi:MAG: DUF4235 domain-containing protein [Actinomycetes bacterium]
MDSKPSASKFLVPAIAMGATWAVKRGLETGYRLAFGQAPPDRTDEEARLLNIVAWAVTTAAVVAVIDVVVTRVLTPTRSTGLAN